MAPAAVKDFFASTIERVLGPHMRASGFRLDATSEHRVTYSNKDVIVSFGYYIEDLPSPWVAIDVGRRIDGADIFVPLWRSIRESEAARKYTRWQFADQSGLEKVLSRIATELLPTHARRLWADDTVFSRVLSEQDVEIQGEHRRTQDRAALIAARRAFDDGEYETALEKYALLGSDGLPAEDRRRLHQARTQLGDRGSTTS